MGKLEFKEIPDYTSSDDPTAKPQNISSVLEFSSIDALCKGEEGKEQKPEEEAEEEVKRGIWTSPDMPLVQTSLWDRLRHRRISDATPDEVKSLEKVFSDVYKAPVRITRVRDMPQTRKEVKLVRFMIPNDEWLYKAWIFKADPVQTRKEMVIYYVASMNKVSTAKPLGYIPHQNESRYPYDIAILSGGPVEHAGMPYSELIYDVAIPRFVHNAAVEVAKLIADTHVRLTMQKSYIESFNVYLQPQKPDFEIRARLARGLGIYTENKFITTICQLCNAMYLQQRGSYVVSHCDLHTGNIVTKQKEDAESLRDFGLIDWGSTNLDHWEADLVDFFIHHKREALRANQKYNYDIKDLIKSYVNHFNATADSLGLEYNVSFDPRTLIIQSMLWNLYEMFDPTRTEPKDVMQKAIYHGSSFMRDLETLEHNGCKDIAREIRFSAQCLFHTTPGYGYMKAVVGHIGQASRRTFWPFAKFS